MHTKSDEISHEAEHLSLGGRKSGASQAAEKTLQAVIPIRQPTERNLALSVFNAVRDSSSPVG
jgi:hypothetical protein